MKKDKLLQGHKQIGKRFVTPMNQLPNFRSARYVDDMLPELIWVALMIDRIDYVPAARQFESFCKIAIDALDEQRSGFAFASTYGAASDDEKSELVRKLDAAGLLEDVRESIGPLNRLYPTSPLAFIGMAEAESDDCLFTMEDCVGRFINKHETPGIVLNGMILTSELITETISFSAEMDLPDFNSVLTDPDSDSAKHAGGFLRAHALSSFGFCELDSKWARDFWNRNLELYKCDFETSSHD